MSGLSGGRPSGECDERNRGFVTSLLCRGKEEILQTEGACAGREWRLCVLGAAPCNDLNLARLVAEFHRVVLVDLDGESLASGVATQGFSGDERIEVRGGLDFTGIHHRLLELRRANGLPANDLDELIGLAETATWSDLPEKST